MTLVILAYRTWVIFEYGKAAVYNDLDDLELTSCRLLLLGKPV